MKKKEVQELLAKPEAELHALLREARERLESLSIERAAGKLKNVQEIRTLKRYAARILTALNSAKDFSTL